MRRTAQRSVADRSAAAPATRLGPNRSSGLLATLLLALLPALLLATESADPFDGFEAEYLTDAADYPRWAALLARQAQDRPALQACLDERSRCPGYLRGYHVLIDRAQDVAPDRQLRLVNHYINNRRWRDKFRSEDWQTLDAFFRRGGACEDFAIAKYFVLRELGFAADDLRVVIAWDRRNRAHHAVLAAVLDSTVHLLDMDNTLTRGVRHRDYDFLFSLNEHGVWDHGAM